MIFWQLGLAVKKHQLTETFSWLNLRAAVTVAVGTDAPGPPPLPAWSRRFATGFN